jgi:hypothetical protein
MNIPFGQSTESLNQEILVSQEKITPDIEAIKGAQAFFESKGLLVESNGFISQNLNPTQIAELKRWHESTTVGSGIQMDTIDDFYKKVLLAVSLWHQSDAMGTTYLLGKGIGVEVALQGKVLGRKKKAVDFSYRSHSDFELYGVNDGSNGNLFEEVFPGEESFSSESRRTKGLVNLPPDLLSNTFETVDLGGVKILVPELEILFLDKYVAPEQTPREEGFDAELLAKQYELNRNKIHEYLDLYVIEPTIQKIEQSFEDMEEEQMEAVVDFISFSVQELQIPGEILSTDSIVNNINLKIKSHIDTYKDNLDNVSISGLELFLWKDLEPGQIDTGGNIIDPSFRKNLRERIESWKRSQIDTCKNLHAAIDTLLVKADKFIDAREGSN